jgi:hypothetical protein
MYHSNQYDDKDSYEIKIQMAKKLKSKFVLGHSPQWWRKVKKENMWDFKTKPTLLSEVIYAKWSAEAQKKCYSVVFVFIWTNIISVILQWPFQKKR